MAIEEITREQWETLLNRYASFKKLFIECEETDPELNTNMQPMNELRAVLDHLIRVIAIEKLGSTEYDVKSQFDKLSSHIRRAFFDVCDMLAINYRNKIVDALTPFSSKVIIVAVDNYYKEIKPFIGSLDLRIADYRNNKGKEEIEESIVVAYEEDVLKLKDFYLSILDRLEALEELQAEENEAKTVEKKNRTTDRIIGIIVGAAGIIAGVLIAIFA